MHIKPLPFVVLLIWAAAFGYFFLSCLTDSNPNVAKTLVGILSFKALLGLIVFYFKRTEAKERLKQMKLNQKRTS